MKFISLLLLSIPLFCISCAKDMRDDPVASLKACISQMNHHIPLNRGNDSIASAIEFALSEKHGETLTDSGLSCLARALIFNGNIKISDLPEIDSNVENVNKVLPLLYKFCPDLSKVITEPYGAMQLFYSLVYFFPDPVSYGKSRKGYHWNQWFNVSYDVKKTDSLISPYAAYIYAEKISYFVGESGSYMKCGHIEYKIQLTFQDGYWKIKSATEKNHDMDKYEEPVEKTMEMFAELKSALGL